MPAKKKTPEAELSSPPLGHIHPELLRRREDHFLCQALTGSQLEPTKNYLGRAAGVPRGCVPEKAHR